MELTPASNAVGWVITLDTESNHLGDDDLFAGKWGGWTYYGLIQFDLSTLPADATIQGAQLILYTQTKEFVNGGEWAVQLFAPDMDAGFTSITFPQADGATILGAVGSPIDETALANAGQANTVTFQAERVTDLQTRADTTRKVSFRIVGPPADGSTYSLHSWDTGYGIGGLGPDFKPTLRLNFLSILNEE